MVRALTAGAGAALSKVPRAICSTYGCVHDDRKIVLLLSFNFTKNKSTLRNSSSETNKRMKKQYLKTNKIPCMSYELWAMSECETNNKRSKFDRHCTVAVLQHNFIFFSLLALALGISSSLEIKFQPHAGKQDKSWDNADAIRKEVGGGWCVERRKRIFMVRQIWNS